MAHRGRFGSAATSGLRSCARCRLVFELSERIACPVCGAAAAPGFDWESDEDALTRSKTVEVRAIREPKEKLA